MIFYFKGSHSGQSICFRALFTAFRPAADSLMFALRQKPEVPMWNEGYYELQFGIYKPEDNGNQVIPL